MSDIFEQLSRIQSTGQQAVLATVVESVGSTPCKPGARMILLPDGTIHGTVGGGALEHHIMGLVPEVLRAGVPRLVPLHLANDLGMSCGGRTTVFLEPIGADDRLYLFGAGHIGQHLCEMAARCGFRVIVCDDRDELRTPARFPSATHLFGSAEPRRLGELDLRENAARAYVVVVTHTHELDFGLVRAIAPIRPAYLGMIGSKRKRATLDKYLDEAGFPEELKGSIRSPAGIPLGGQSPAEIALSIAAELVAERSERLSGESEGRAPEKAAVVEAGAVIGAVVPAAGRSSRMGRPKPLLPLGDTDFIGRILGTLRGCGLVVFPVVVVTREGDEALQGRLDGLAGPDLRMATVPDDDGDMLRSLRAGARLLGEAAGALVWPVDAPAVRSETVLAVGRAALAHPERVAQPVLDGRPGHPTYVPRAIFEAEGPGAEQGLRGLLAAASPPPTQVSIEDPYSLLNVNTPAEYEALQRAFRG